MGKNQSASNLTNIIKQDASGNISFVSGSTTLMSVSSSGAITTTGNVAGTASYASNAELFDGLDSTVFTLTSSFAAQTASFTAFTASQNILNGTYATTGSNTFTGIQTINSNLVVTGSITAQTLVVQTITSSVDFVTGSTRFGSTGSNTHVFTGSILSNGAIGIGTSSPTSGYSLDVNGPSYFRSTTVITGSGGTYLSIRTTSSADAAVFMFDGANTGYVGLNVGSNPNKFIIYYAADTRMAIDTSGRVGFGTASPSYNLEISSGSSSPTELAIVNTNAGGAARLSLRNTERDFIITSNTADDLLSFAYGGSNRLQFNTTNQWFNSGNVGIGTNSPSNLLSVVQSNSASSTTLDITNSSNASTTTKTAQLLFRISDTANDQKPAASIIAYPDGVNVISGGMYFSTRASDGGPFERMRITSGGNVGIGTTGPETKLHIEGSTAIGTTGTESILLLGRAIGAGASFQQAAALKLGRYQNAGGSFESYTRLDFALRDNSASSNYNTNTTVMTLTNASRVGIGVTAPDAGLQIAAPGQDDQLTIGSIANNRDHAAFMCSSANKAEILRYQSGVRLVIASSSNITNVDIVPGGSVGVRLSAGNTSWSAYTSDERKKKNFETVPGLEAIMQINPVKYHFKTQEDSDIKKLGFIAQNIQPLVPEMVHPNGEKAEDGSDILTIIPDYILPVLTKAIQELKAENDTLKEILQRNNIQ